METSVNYDKRLADLERKVRVLGDALGVRQPAPTPSQTEAPDPATKYLVLVGTTMDDVPVRLCDTLADARILAKQPDLWRMAERALKDVLHRDVPEFTGVSIVTFRNRYPTMSEYVRDFTPPPAKRAAPTAEAESAKVQLLMKKLEEDLQCERERVRMLTDDNAHLTKKLAEYADTIDRHKKSLSDSHRGNVRLQRERAAAMEQCAELEKQLLQRDQELESHRSRLDCNDSLRTEIVELKAQRHDLRDAMSTVLAKLFSVRETAEQALDD